MKKIKEIEIIGPIDSPLAADIVLLTTRLNEVIDAVNSLIATSQFEKEVTKAGIKYGGKTPFPEDSV